MQNYRFLGHIT